jgi:hypothetical protein
VPTLTQRKECARATPRIEVGRIPSMCVGSGTFACVLLIHIMSHNTQLVRSYTRIRIITDPIAHSPIDARECSACGAPMVRIDERH